jgi:acyl carrier protein
MRYWLMKSEPSEFSIDDFAGAPGKSTSWFGVRNYMARNFMRDQMQLDSMDFLDIVMELRKRHGIEVPEKDYQQLASLDSCADYLTPKFDALTGKS